MLFEIASNKMVIEWSRKAANADGILTDPLTVGANKNVVQGVSAYNILNCLKDNMTCFYIRALAIILEPTRWLTTVAISTSKSNDADREAASWKGTSCMRHRQHALFARFLAWLATAAPRSDLGVGDQRTRRKSIFLTTALEVAAGSALSTVIDTMMPIQEREQWADDVANRSTTSRTLGFRFRLCVYFETIDVLSINRHCRKRCGAGVGQFFSPLFMLSSSTGATAHARRSTTSFRSFSTRRTFCASRGK